MFNLKTHYEQVPLEIVRKIMAEQPQAGTKTAGYPEIDEETRNEVPFGAEGQSITQPLMLGEKSS
jgi:hypothetical protein